MIQKPKYIPKGWGFERIVVNNDFYCGKELFIAKDRKFSMHFHQKKTETFYVIKGNAELQYAMLPPEEQQWGDADFFRFCRSKMNVIVLEPGDVFHVPVRMVHQITAISDFTMMEFSTHDEESDSYRITKGD